MLDLVVRNSCSEAKFNWHPFPVIDFKFRNSGNGTALLSKYHIEITEAKIDVAPYLKFDWCLQGGKAEAIGLEELWSQEFVAQKNHPIFEIGVRNFGWGEARSLAVALNHNEMMLALFGSCRDTIEKVVDDDRVVALALDIKKMNYSEFQKYAAMHVDFCNRVSLTEAEEEKQYDEIRSRLGQIADQVVLRSQWHGRSHQSPFIAELLAARKPFVVVEIKQIPFEWNCSDIEGRSYREEETLDANHRCKIVITEEGFSYLPGEPAPEAEMPPGPTFCALIDPDRGPHTRSYPISRRIDPGDVERFQFYGKSCFLDVRLAFDVDGRIRVESGVFELHIENRRDQQFHLRYRDGQEVLASVTEAQEIENRQWQQRALRDNW